MTELIKSTIYCLTAFSLITILGTADAAVRKSKAIPENSPRTSQEVSEFTLHDPRVALRDIEKAGEKKDVSKISQLIRAYRENARRKDGYGPSIQHSIIQTLAQIKSKNSSDFLIQLLTKTKEISLKDEIAYALGEIGDKRALGELEKYLDMLLAGIPEEPLIRYQWQMYIKQVRTAMDKIERK
ncbi:HEAT repeat domain-containing protein [bacterium]|nr:HEAT repeat domain-containing protein [bacterium]